MTRDFAFAQFAALDTPAIIAAMRQDGYTGSGAYDDVCAYVVKVMDRITKTSAATLAKMSDWREVVAHSSGKGKTTPAAADLPGDITGKGWRIEYNGPAGRVQLIFDKCPRESIRRAVKDAGFYWSPVFRCWQRKLTRKAQRAAEDLARRITTMGL